MSPTLSPGNSFPWITYGPPPLHLTGYSDADWTEDVNT